MNTGSKTKWIKELDGLRAVAVLLVLLFHAQIEAFSGGGIGVDIFFVISGFIITLKLAQDHEGGGIHLISFWQNRFARLVPAMLVVTAFVLLASPFFFSGGDLERIFLATTASLIYVSNFFFFAEAGYFDAGSLAKPMLHTWSLAVEEQFYLFWPLFIIALFRAPRRVWPFGFAVLGAASLIFAFWADSSNPSMAFYMMPARIYQFCAGAVIAITLVNIRGLAGTGLFLSALAGLIAVAVLVDPESDGLLLSHVLPTALTAAVIASIRSSVATRLLATAPTVFVGKISYSVYLAHWPLMVFYFNQNQLDLGVFAPVALVLASIAAGYGVHALVETRLRFTSKTSESRRRTVLWTIATSTALVVGAAALVTPSLRPQIVAMPVPVEQTDTDSRLQNAAFVESGPLRVHMQARALYGECSFTFTGTYAVNQDALDECLTTIPDRINIAVIGSSVSDAPFVALRDSLAEERFHIAKAGLAGCDPHLNPEAMAMAREAFTRACRNFNTRRLSLVLENDFDIIVLVGQWVRLHPDETRNIVTHIRDNGAVPVVVGPTPSFSEDIVTLLGRMPVGDRLGASFQEVVLPILTRRNQQVREIARDSGVPYVNLYDYICRPDDCTSFNEYGQLLYYDRIHLTQAGSDLISPLVTAAVYEAVIMATNDS